ncbi:MAG TPA: hypothetical protein VN628_04435 [Vicinamibacterales bacterium]|nr:hypothetical protein [Vicinamibacterales bacterium]
MGRPTQLDDLFTLPPEEFTAARNALAKTLAGDAAKDVKALRKPNAVAWSANNLYWKARAQWDALMKAGHALRDAQIGALKGRKTDVRAATEKHREALSHAVKRAHEIAQAAGVHPNTDQLARMLDALSLSAGLPDDVGRFSDVVQPSGFDALAGVKPAAHHGTASSSSRDELKKKKAEEDAKLRREAEQRLDAAQEALRDAREKADTAKRALNRAEADVRDAEREVEAAEAQVKKREA